MNHEQDHGKDTSPFPTPERDAPLPHPFAEAAEAEPFFPFEAESAAHDAPALADTAETRSKLRKETDPLPPPVMPSNDAASLGKKSSGSRKIIGFLQASAALGSALLMRGAIGDGGGYGAQTISVGITLGGSFLFLYSLMQFIAGKDVAYPKANAILRGGSFAVIGVAAIVTLSRWTTPMAAPEPVAALAGTADLTAQAAEAAAKAAQMAARAETERQITKLRDDLKTSVGGNTEIETIRKELNAYIAANNQRLHSLEEAGSNKTILAASAPAQPEATKGLQALQAARSLREQAKIATPERALSLLTDAKLRLKEAETALKAAGLPGKLAEARLGLAETLDELSGGEDVTSPEQCPAGSSSAAWRAREAAEAYTQASTPEAQKAAPAVAAAALNGKGKSLFLTRAYTEAADAFYESAALFRENGMMAEAGVAERNRGESLNALSYCPKDNAEKITLLKKALQSYESAALYFEAAGDKAALTAVQARLRSAQKRMGEMADGPGKKELYAKAQDTLHEAPNMTH